MKLLLTGPPRTGKSTLLKQVIEAVPGAEWAVCAEIRDSDNNRVGFTADTSSGAHAVIAHKTDIQSTQTIGDYRVDVDAIDETLTKTVSQAISANHILLLDEIGRMQMLSGNFANAINQLFASDTNFLATIRYGDDWTKKYTERPDVALLTLTEANRDAMLQQILLYLGQ